MASDWITTEEALEMSGYHEEHLRELLREGKIKAQKWSFVWQISRSSLQAYLKQVKELGEKRGPKKKGLTS